MKTNKENPTTQPRFLTSFGMTLVAVLCLVPVLLQAGEIRFGVGETSFVRDTLSNGQSFEAFKFDLPQIPQGARIDFAGLILHIDRPDYDPRDTTKNGQLAFSLAPITTDWNPASVRNGQQLTVERRGAPHAVADYVTGNRVELDITRLAQDWLKGTKVNRGFMLAPAFAQEKSGFAVRSDAGVKVEVVIYYTGPEIVKE